MTSCMLGYILGCLGSAVLGGLIGWFWHKQKPIEAAVLKKDPGFIILNKKYESANRNYQSLQGRVKKLEADRNNYKLKYETFEPTMASVSQDYEALKLEFNTYKKTTEAQFAEKDAELEKQSTIQSDFDILQNKYALATSVTAFAANSPEEKTVEVPVEIIKEIEVVKEIEKIVEVPVEIEKIVEVTKEVEKIVIVEKPIEIVKELTLTAIQEVPYEAVREVQIEVKKMVEIPIEVVKEVETIVYRDNPIEVVKEISLTAIDERSVESIREVEVEKLVEVPVEVIKEVEKIVEIEKPIEVIKELELTAIEEKSVESIREVEVSNEVIDEIVIEPIQEELNVEQDDLVEDLEVINSIEAEEKSNEIEVIESSKTTQWSWGDYSFLNEKDGSIKFDKFEYDYQGIHGSLNYYYWFGEDNMYHFLYADQSGHVVFLSEGFENKAECNRIIAEFTNSLDTKESFFVQSNKGQYWYGINDEVGDLIGNSSRYDSEEALAAWFIRFAPIKANTKDNLRKIEGIGPKIEQLLNNAEIHTWKKLAITSHGILRAILNEGGSRFRMHDPSTWPQQAQLAHEGKWEELKVLQDELKGGKKI